jgi:hypothetical protein
MNNQNLKHQFKKQLNWNNSNPKKRIPVKKYSFFKLEINLIDFTPLPDGVKNGSKLKQQPKYGGHLQNGNL